jgi:adenylate cyclase
MADLIAQGIEPQQRWRRSVPVDSPVLVGRGSGGWGIDWDPQVSRQHIEIAMDGQRLRVRRLPDATNPVFFHGQNLHEFVVSSGEHFVIGKTRLTFVTERPRVSMDHPSPDSQRKFAPDKLRKLEYRDAARRIAVLTQLPDVISRSVSEDDLHINLVNLLLSGIRRANSVAIVQLDDGESVDSPVRILHWDQRMLTDKAFVPSGSLIKGAIESGETELHFWRKGRTFGDAHRTVLSDGDWAMATPIRGPSPDRIAIYISGNYALPPDQDPASDPLDLRDDVKFTELVATSLGNLRHVRQLERHQAGLRSFFSPIVLDALSGSSPDDVLLPRECEVSVMFCDLRGFSLKSEQAANDLLGLLDRTSSALGVTTRQILEQRGVVGDFHGDAAMGFWGWPLDQPDRAERACRAALEIQRQFAAFSRQAGHPLRDFRVGVGIATGTAVAGRIGTDDQVKVTAFGPVVNLAARLESMNQQLGTGILIDGRTDALLRTRMNEETLPSFRVRRLAIVQPFGMTTTVSVSQLLPGAGDPGHVSDSSIAVYERALDAFTSGKWDNALEWLHHLPADDVARDFLTRQIDHHNRVAPGDWTGVIQMRQK